MVSGRMKNMPGPSAGELLGLGVALAVAVVVPLFAGLWIDSAKHTTPLGVMVGLLIGIVAATTILYQRFKRYW